MIGGLCKCMWFHQQQDVFLTKLCIGAGFCWLFLSSSKWFTQGGHSLQLDYNLLNTFSHITTSTYLPNPPESLPSSCLQPLLTPASKSCHEVPMSYFSALFINCFLGVKVKICTILSFIAGSEENHLSLPSSSLNWGLRFFIPKSIPSLIINPFLHYTRRLGYQGILAHLLVFNRKERKKINICWALCARHHSGKFVFIMSNSTLSDDTFIPFSNWGSLGSYRLCFVCLFVF